MSDVPDDARAVVLTAFLQGYDYAWTVLRTRGVEEPDIVRQYRAELARMKAEAAD